MTLDENIADNLGLKIAFETFERSVRERRRGNWRNFDDFNDEQLFFASFAFVSYLEIKIFANFIPWIYTK